MSKCRKWSTLYHKGCCFSVAQSCLTLCDPWTAACQTSLSFTISPSLLKPMSIKSVRPFNHFILCCPLLLLPSIFPSIRVFSNESVLRIRWPKYWSFSFRISPSNEYSGLISFRIDWFDLLAVVFPIVMYGCECWTMKKAEHWRIDVFKLWFWRRLSRVLCTARRSNQSIQQETDLEYSLVGLLPKPQYFGHMLQRADSLGKTWCWERLKAKGEGRRRRWGC